MHQTIPNVLYIINVGKKLDQELLSKSWIVVANQYESDIIRKSTQAFWREKMMELGGDYLLWSNAPENPSLN